MIRSVYISKTIEDVLLLRDFCQQNGISLTTISQISFRSLTFNIHKPFDVIFFSSPRSVEYFLQFISIPIEIKIACVGSGTAKHLEAMGYAIDFFGKTPGAPVQTAKEFASWLGEQRVLFPESDNGLGSMQQFLSPEQYEVISVYSTLYEPAIIAPHDVYVFSSPSNVESFLTVNKVPDGLVIAWGKSTESILRKYGINASYTLSTSSVVELLELLKEKWSLIN